MLSLYSTIETYPVQELLLASSVLVNPYRLDTAVPSCWTPSEDEYRKADAASLHQHRASGTARNCPPEHSATCSSQSSKANCPALQGSHVKAYLLGIELSLRYTVSTSCSKSAIEPEFSRS